MRREFWCPIGQSRLQPWEPGLHRCTWHLIYETWSVKDIKLNFSLRLKAAENLALTASTSVWRAGSNLFCGYSIVLADTPRTAWGWGEERTLVAVTISRTSDNSVSAASNFTVASSSYAFTFQQHVVYVKLNERGQTCLVKASHRCTTLPGMLTVMSSWLRMMLSCSWISAGEGMLAAYKF